MTGQPRDKRKGSKFWLKMISNSNNEEYFKLLEEVVHPKIFNKIGIEPKTSRTIFLIHNNYSSTISKGIYTSLTNLWGNISDSNKSNRLEIDISINHKMKLICKHPYENKQPLNSRGNKYLDELLLSMEYKNLLLDCKFTRIDTTLEIAELGCKLLMEILNNKTNKNKSVVMLYRSFLCKYFEPKHILAVKTYPLNKKALMREICDANKRGIRFICFQDKFYSKTIKSVCELYNVEPIIWTYSEILAEVNSIDANYVIASRSVLKDQDGILEATFN